MSLLKPGSSIYVLAGMVFSLFHSLPSYFHWLQVDINLFQYFELPIIHFQLPISTAEGTLF